MNQLFKWWGYLHQGGSIHAKRVFDHTIESDLNEAFESDFVLYVVAPFFARNRTEALRSIEIDCEAWLKAQK